MSMYQYAGKQSLAAEQQAVEDARQMLEIAKAEHQAVLALRRERRRIERQINHYMSATNEASTPTIQLPDPIYGGRAGLRAATDEAKRINNRNKRKQAV